MAESSLPEACWAALVVALLEQEPIGITSQLVLFFGC